MKQHLHPQRGHCRCRKCGGQGIGRNEATPIADFALLSSKIVKGAILRVYEGAPHGMCTTLKDKVNAELLSFIQA
jgi:hypothetical protein